MIERICIHNYALIEQTELVPAKGFSVITGETGAGKSILLGAVGLTLGQRGDSSVLNDKEKKCIVEITYRISGYDLKEWFEEHDLDYDDTVIVRREIAPDGKSRSFINDTPVNNKDLKEFGNFMIDIHSQHQSLLLGKPEYQIDVLDAFAGNGKILSVYKERYAVRRKKTAELKLLKEQEAEAEKEKDYLNFQLSQLEMASLKEGEKEELEEELALLSNAEAIKSAFYQLTYQFRDADPAVIHQLKEIRHSLISLKNAVKEAEEYEARLDSVIIELKDLAEEAERKAENIAYNPGRIEAINLRLSTIYDLLYKYKLESVSGLLELKEELIAKLGDIQDGAERMASLEAELKQLEAEMQDLSDQIHAARVGASDDLSAKVKELLVSLGIKHAEFLVSLSKTPDFTATGTDEVNFLFSANKNQQAGDISKVASGGEISRLMLSLKYILSKSKQLPVMIFDEIDTGLSGEIAHKMSLIMKEMAGRMQVISISHLPQIASAGDTHFKVYKEDGEQQTVSRIRELGKEERIREIAGMISGAGITKSALETAENLLNNS